MRRQTGETTKQMKGAPQGAIFVWCNDFTLYPKSLVHHIGRPDIQVVRPCDLMNQASRRRGTTIAGIVVDHAADLTHDQEVALSILQQQCRPVPQQGAR
jgi:hypothetical protein